MKQIAVDSNVKQIAGFECETNRVSVINPSNKNVISWILRFLSPKLTTYIVSVSTRVAAYIRILVENAFASRETFPVQREHQRPRIS